MSCWCHTDSLQLWHFERTPGPLRNSSLLRSQGSTALSRRATSPGAQGGLSVLGRLGQPEGLQYGEDSCQSLFTKQVLTLTWGLSGHQPPGVGACRDSPQCFSHAQPLGLKLGPVRDGSPSQVPSQLLKDAKRGAVHLAWQKKTRQLLVVAHSHLCLEILLLEYIP